jgi:hypothetical protein
VSQSEARRILDSRLASGEITEVEYDSVRCRLDAIERANGATPTGQPSRAPNPQTRAESPTRIGNEKQTGPGWWGKAAITVLGLTIGLAIIGVGVVVALTIFGFAMGLVREGTDRICTFRTQFLIQQIPPSLDILAVRHPVSVGLVRKYFNDKGQIDSFIQQILLEFTKSEKLGKDDNLVSCTFQLAMIKLDDDGVRGKIADQAEAAFGLKDLP